VTYSPEWADQANRMLAELQTQVGEPRAAVEALTARVDALEQAEARRRRARRQRGGT
jgi:hypothetical protein